MLGHGRTLIEAIRDESAEANDTGAKDTALANIYALFGAETTLIPVPVGKAVEECSNLKTTFAESRHPDYQVELRKSNVAVRCGRESRGLYAIYFEQRSAYESFLAINAPLRHTLALEIQGGVVMFLRLQEEMPASFQTHSGGWLSEGSDVLVFRRDDPSSLRIISPRSPVQLQFGEISWNDELFVGFKECLARLRHGPPFAKDKKGNMTVNEMYWAGWYFSLSSIKFHSEAHEFSCMEENGASKVVSEWAVGKKLLEFIAEWRGDVPATVISQDVVAKCVRALKLLAVEVNEHVAGAEDVEHFLRARVELCDDRDVTSEELYESYRDWSKTSNVIPLAGRQFFTTLSGCIAKVFSVGKNHCTERNGKERRGYSGLRIKQAGRAKESQDAQDA